MDILKYFYEEPASLEVLTPDIDPDARRRDAPAATLEAWLQAPRAYRGYLAGTDLENGYVGATILRPEAFVDPVLDWLAGSSWVHCREHHAVEPLDENGARSVLTNPSATAVLVAADHVPDAGLIRSVAGVERRYVLPGLHRLLHEVTVVFFPEPAHHGHDWSLFSTRPLREPLVETFRRYPHPHVRRFVAPFQHMRSEHKFYFEQYDLEGFTQYEVR